jgi:polynucleotide 5'-kinase involved in rRNA processing
MAATKKDVKVEYRVFKVCVLGPKNSGKTSFINCAQNNCGNAFYPGFNGDQR